MSDPIRPVALVTGATGGVGSATVDLFADRGYDVVAIDLAAAPERWATDDRIEVVTGDVTLEETAEHAVGVALERFGRLDVLVNNAALFLRKPLLDTTLDDLTRLLAVNVVGAFLFTRAALPALAATGGCIVNLASTSGLVGTPDQSAYSITKGAIVQFTRQSAIEHAHLGVRVNAVAPGPIDTEFVAKAVARGSTVGVPIEVIQANNPLGRISRAEEIADAIVWIAGSPAATGTILSVDGGHTAQ